MSINNLQIYDILYLMLVSNSNNLLNILTANNNNALKEVLKNADAKTLENINKGTTSVENVLKDLFTDLKTGDKNKANLENILKNSNIFKDLGSFSKSLTTLFNQIDNNPALSKYKPLLQNFFKDISTLDDKSLKDLISKSGIFLEAKALQQASSTANNSNIPKNLENILNQIKTILKDIPTIEAKNVTNLIDKIIQNSNTQGNNTYINADLKNLVTQLQNLAKGLPDKPLVNLTNLTNILKDISTKGQLLESKIINNPNQTAQNTQQNSSSLNQNITSTQAQTNQQTANTQQGALNLNQVLNQLKVELLTNNSIPNSQNLLKQLDTLMQSNLEPKAQLNQLINSMELKNLATQNPNINQALNSLKTINENITNTTQTNLLSNLPQQKEVLNNKILETLAQLRSELSSNKIIPNTQAIIKEVDSLLQTKDLFSPNISQVEPKNLLSQLVNLNEIKTIANQNPSIASLISNIKTNVDNINLLENKVMQNINIQAEKLQLTNQIQVNLSSLKNELINVKNVNTSLINQLVDKLLNIQNLFSKIELPLDMKSLQQLLLNQNTSNSFQNNFSSNLNTLILTLKESITNLSSNPNNLVLQQNIVKNIEKLESILNNINQTSQTVNFDKQQVQNSLQNDMKTVLLQMQNELLTKTDVSSQETLKQVDKMIMQIEYHQLLSIASNSNNIYVPFFWEMLEDGNISMKKVDEDKFYCEINLSLKEFGQTQLMLALYDKNKLDLTIYASKESFKQSIRENSTKLKQALNSVDLIPVNINIIDLKKPSEEENQKTNAYNQNINLGFGVDIRA